MNKINFNAILISLILISFISTAQAGFSITRMTTIVDDFSGSYTVTKSGRLEDQEYNGTSITEFSNFHPFAAKVEASLSGTLSKTVVRVDDISSHSDAQLTLSTADNSLSISFTGLSFEINAAQVSLSGEVTANNETYDAADLPPQLAKLLKKIFFLTRK